MYLLIYLQSKRHLSFAIASQNSQEFLAEFTLYAEGAVFLLKPCSLCLDYLRDFASRQHIVVLLLDKEEKIWK